MPPKLTSKNIFDVVFAPLPADAFIDTGPASLREELMLEAAGLSSSSSSADHSGRGGSSSYRRHLLPASVVSGNAGGHGKSSSSSAAAGGGSGGAKAGQSAAARSARSLLEEDEDDLLRDNDGGNDDASAVAPPAYDASAPAGTGASTAKAAQHPHKARSADPPKPSSLFRRVDDGEEAAVGVVRAPPRRHGAAPALDASGRGGTAEALGSGADLAIQMDAEDDAVREATKYARHLATAEADGDSGVAGSTERATAATAVTGEGAGGQSSGHGTAGALADELAEGATARGQQQAGGAATSTAAAANAPLGGVSPAAPYATQRRGPLTAAEQLALMPPGLDHVYTGSCVTYRHPKGFGFVSPDLGGPDVYFVNDAITLSFTRLALRAFYIKNGMPVPASVAMAYRAPPAAELPAVVEEASGALPGQQKTAEGEAEEEEDETKEGSGKEGNNEEPQPASTEAVQKADEAEEGEGTADGAPPQPPSHSAVAATEEEEEEEPATTAGVLGDAPPLPLPSPLTTASALHQSLPSVFAGMGGSAAMAAAAGMDIGDCVSIPPTTPQELQYAEAAAALLTPATAQLLQHQINQGFTGGLRVGERLSFVVTRNQAGRGGNGRLLRAEWVRGLPTAAYAMPVEQAWFSPMFVGAVGRKVTGNPSAYGSRHRTPHPAEAAPVGGGSVVDIATAAALPAAAGGGDGGQGSTALVRYTGCVRTYDAEDQRGYLRCDEIDPSGGVTPDVVFYAHAVLWDTARCPPLKRQVQESMRVAYSVCATERNGKYVATLITTVDGEAFCEENITYADNVQPYYMAEGSRRRGREDHHSGNMHGGGRGGGGGGGGGGNADGGNIGGDSGQHSNNSSNNASGGNSNAGGGGGGDRKRAKVADEDLLLFEEDDYPFM